MAEAKPQTESGFLASPQAANTPESGHIYRALRELLDQHGWIQGRCTKGRLTLDVAVDQLLRTRVGDPASGADLARAARVTAHLRELSGASNLASWNDAAGRRLEDVHELLVLAGRAYPTD